MSRIYHAAPRVPRNQKTTTACMRISHPVDLVHIWVTSQDTAGRDARGALVGLTPRVNSPTSPLRRGPAACAQLCRDHWTQRGTWILPMVGRPPPVGRTACGI